MKNLYLSHRKTAKFTGKKPAVLSIAKIFLLLLLPAGLFAQAPAIHYNSTYTIFPYQVITVAPANTGGAVPPTQTCIVSTLAGNDSLGFANGTGAAATFNGIRGVACDSTGDVYVADQNNRQIRKITPAGVVTTFAGSGAAANTDGTGTGAAFNFPIGITSDRLGNIYVGVGLAGDNEIRKITPAGVVTTITHQFGPGNLAADALGNVYTRGATSPGDTEVYKISPTGTASYWVAYHTVSMDAANNLYVTSLDGDGVVRYIVEFDPNRNDIAQYEADGFAALEAFTADGANNIYGADNFTIKKITYSGNFQTDQSAITPFAGTGDNGYADGAGNVAKFGYISGITMSRTGIIYVADMGNNRVRKVVATGYFIYPTLPKGILFDTRTGILSGKATVNSPLTTYTVTAYNSSGSSTTTFNMEVTANNELKAMTTSHGILSPVFNKDSLHYNVTVADSITSIQVTPTANISTASITVNGVAVTSGNLSQVINLRTGGNNIAVSVTVGDNVGNQEYYFTRTYTIYVYRTPNNNLAGLQPSNGVLSPDFAAGTVNYTDAVNNSVSSIAIRPTAADTSARIKVNGTAVASGALSQNIPLNVGANTIQVVVAAQDTVSTKTYTVVVNRAGSANDNLADLHPSNGAISPTFAPGTINYTDQVNTSVASIAIRPTAADATATIKVNGTVVASGALSPGIPLNFGANTIRVVVTAQDGVTTKTYTLVVTRPGSANDNLTDLHPSKGALSPAFSAGTINYTDAVNSTVSSIAIRPTAADTTATIRVDGTVVASGALSPGIPLNFGADTVHVVVTAQDGVSTKTYTVVVNRAASTNDNLTDLHPSNGALSPAFVQGTLNYTDTVNSTVTAIAFRPSVADATAVITFNGNVVPSGSLSPSVPINFGSNTFFFVVTAQDGVTKKTYSVNVVRKGASNALLSSLHPSNGTLNPLFTSATNNYTANVTNAVSSITVTAILADTNATMKINGTAARTRVASPEIPLTVGANTITTVVTAQDGVTINTYTLTVTRAGLPSGNSVYQQTSVQGLKTDSLRNDDILLVHQAVTPNGDGRNDVLTIDNIQNYPNNTLRIISNNGDIVYEARGYNNSTKAFDGHSSITGKLQQPGTYFYSLDYTANGQSKRLTGYIVLKY